MSLERWGTLSVKDHLNLEALVADILLYDRLVFPVFSGPKGRTFWRRKKWDPDLQENQIEWLGDRAVRVDWNAERVKKYRDLRKARRQIADDAFQSTRIVLAMDEHLPRPEGVTGVRAVAAYHDLEKGARDLRIKLYEPDRESLGKLAFVIAQRLLVPTIDTKADPKELISQAAALSRGGTYQKKRGEFYAWQETTVDAVAQGRQSIDGAVEQMQGYITDLNREIRDRWTKFAFKTVLTVVGVAIPFALGLEKLELLAAIPGAFELVKFGALEVPDKPAEMKCEVAAMLVTAKKGIG